MWTPEMPFGKYRGLRLDEIPHDYLRWLLANVELRPWLEDAIRERLGEAHSPAHGLDADGVRGEMLAAVEKLRRRLAARLHPDRGGDPETMKQVNDGCDELAEAIRAATE